MFNIGSQELLVILVVVLLLFGAKRIPEVSRALGKGLSDFRDALSGVERELKGEGPRPTPPRIQPPDPAQAPVPRNAGTTPEPAPAGTPEPAPAQIPEPGPSGTPGEIIEKTTTPRPTTPVAPGEAPGGSAAGARPIEWVGRPLPPPGPKDSGAGLAG